MSASETRPPSRKQVVEQPHPSELPENNLRTDLYKIFHEVLVPKISEVFGKGSNHEPPPGFERAWRIILGANIEGNMHFICHVAEDFTTAKAYNSSDFAEATCPVLLFGEPFHIRSDLLAKIREQFPVHHQGKVPYQAAFAMTHDAGAHDTGSVLDLMNGDIEAVVSGFRIRKMASSGMQSLSFTSQTCPLQFWTHASRAPVIFTALDKEREKVPPNQETIDLYEEACRLERAFKAALNQLRDQDKELEKTIKSMENEKQSLEGIVRNDRIPTDRKQEIIQKKEADIAQLNAEITRLQTESADIYAKAKAASQAIDAFKRDNHDRLPNSYREATFQIAFEIKRLDGSTVYKQYNGDTGNFETGSSPEDIRYGDGVHNTYLQLPIQ